MVMGRLRKGFERRDPRILGLKRRQHFAVVKRDIKHDLVRLAKLCCEYATVGLCPVEYREEGGSELARRGKAYYELGALMVTLKATLLCSPMKLLDSAALPISKFLAQGKG